MVKVPRNLIRAIQKAGITLDPSHAAFRHVAESVLATIDREAEAVEKATRKRKELIRNVFIAAVGEVTLGTSYVGVRPDRIRESITIFSHTIRSTAAEIVTEQNRKRGGEADEPPPKVHEHKPIKGTKGKKKF